MVSFKSSLVRSVVGVGLAASLLFPLAPASADPSRGSIAISTPPPTPGQTVAISPPPTKLVAPVAADTVVLDDFTPPALRSTGGTGALSTAGRTSQGGTTHHGVADDFKGGPGCSIQCITSGVAYARGVGANLVVKTDTSANIFITVWNDDGYHKMVNSGAGHTQFSHHFDDLDPHTFYYAMAVAQDGEGYVSDGFGHFTTLTRNVELSFTTAMLYETPYGNDDFFKHVWLENEYVEGLSFGPYAPEGDSLPLGINIFTLEDTDQYLDLHIELRQYDESADLCEAVPLPETPSAGSWDCTTWAHVTFDGGPQDLDNRPNGATSWTQHTIERTLILPGGNALPGGYGAPLNFSVLVTMDVWYD